MATVQVARVDEPRAPRTGARRSFNALVLVGERALAPAVQVALSHGNYNVRMTATVGQALEALTAAPPELAIIDLDVEAGRGIDVVAHAKRLPRVGVITLTRRGDLLSKLAAFERGADDVINIPFFPEELVARALAVVRRVHGEDVLYIPRVAIGGIAVDLTRRRVRAGGAEVELTPTEHGILWLLIANRGRVVTTEELLRNLWGDEYLGTSSNVVARHVRGLREKLEEEPRRPQIVQTVRGKGYRLARSLTSSTPVQASIPQGRAAAAR